MCVGNEAMQHQLEFDLTNMSKEKRARKNALRRRVGGGPAGGIGGSQSNPSADGQSRSEIPLLAPTQAPRQPPASPSTDLGAQNAVFIPGASLRRLAAGSAGAEDWNVADKDSPRLGAPGMPAVSTRTSSGASASRRNRKAANTKNFEEVNSNRPAMDAAVNGADMLRNHEWVIERVKLRKQEESRKKRERYGSKSKSAVWLPSVEQVSLSFLLSSSRQRIEWIRLTGDGYNWVISERHHVSVQNALSPRRIFIPYRNKPLCNFPGVLMR